MNKLESLIEDEVIIYELNRYISMDFVGFHKYAEKIMGRHIAINEFESKEFREKIEQLHLKRKKENEKTI